MNDPLEPLGLNLKMIQDSPQTWSINKSVAFKLALNQFMTVGDFFKNLSDADLNFLNEKVELIALNAASEEVTEDVMEAETEMMLLNCLLSIAEGLDIASDDEVMMMRSTILLTLVTSELLCRKGLVTLQRENMSLGEDAYDLELARLTDAGRAFFNAATGDDQE